METPLSELKQVPRFIFIDNQYLRHEIVSNDPKLADLISDDFTEDTAIVVSTGMAKASASVLQGRDRGVVFVDRDGFKAVMRRIWTFVDSYKKGSSIKKSVQTLVNMLEEGNLQ